MPSHNLVGEKRGTQAGQIEPTYNLTTVHILTVKTVSEGEGGEEGELNQELTRSVS